MGEQLRQQLGRARAGQGWCGRGGAAGSLSNAALKPSTILGSSSFFHSAQLGAGLSAAIAFRRDWMSRKAVRRDIISCLPESLCIIALMESQSTSAATAFSAKPRCCVRVRPCSANTQAVRYSDEVLPPSGDGFQHVSGVQRTVRAARNTAARSIWWTSLLHNQNR